MATILIPLPSRDFDPTEAAIPWEMLTRLGHTVTFATPDGKPGVADDMMLTGEGLDPWGWIPGLKHLPLVGRLLRANRDAQSAYSKMTGSHEFLHPWKWDEMDATNFDGLFFPGGHRTRGMTPYLESPKLQSLAVAFFHADKPVGAICHGVLILARAIDPMTGKSVLHGRNTTALTWRLEHAAAKLGRIVRFWDPQYYRTYSEAPGQPVGYMSVEHEIARALERPEHFVDVPADAKNYRKKTSGLVRDTADNQDAAFVVRDGNYVSARWPGDAHKFAITFAERFEPNGA
jgi:putative intracellular protease/amidase